MALSSIKVLGQVGIGTVNPHTGSILELNSTNQGLLLTRVSLASTTSWGLSGTPIEGMKVYNTNQSIIGSSTAPKLLSGKGVYYWSDSKWVAVGEVDNPTRIVRIDGVGCSLSSPNNFTSAVVDPIDLSEGGVLADPNTIYINKCDGSSWSYASATNQYFAYNSILSTSFNIYNTNVDAGSNKFVPITRSGNIYTGSETGKSVALLNNQSSETTLSFFNRSVVPNKNYSFRANTTYRPDFFDLVSNGAPATIPSGIMMAFNRNTGKVGFNNEFPDERLDVWSNNGEESGIRIGQHAIGSFRLTIPANEYKFNIGIANDHIITFTNERRVGIGATNPTEKLQVEGNLRFSGALMPNNIAGTTGQVLLSSGADNAPVWSDVSSLASNNIYNIDGTLSDNRIVNQGTRTLAFFSFANNGFSVDGSTFSVDSVNNRIGIGTINPSAKLEVLTSPLTDFNYGLKVNGTGTFALNTHKTFAVTTENVDRAVFYGDGKAHIGLGGNVGIGTVAPASKLDVLNTPIADYEYSTRINATGTFANATHKTLAVMTDGVDRNVFYANGKVALGLAENVGIGTSFPTEKLHVIGNILATGTISSTSDVRLKSNIVEINKGLELLLKTRPVSYDKRLSLDPSVEESVHENGFIAQELQKVIPSIVTENKDEYNTLSVNYISLIPILVKSIQEQQEIIKKQQETIEKMNQRLELLELKK